MLLLKFPVALTCFTVVYLTTEAANTHPTSTECWIPGLSGRDDNDGQPGHDGQPKPVGHDSIVGPAGRDSLDGLPGPCCTLTYTEQQQLKEDILEILLKEIRTMDLCNTANPCTHQSLQRSGSSMDISNSPIPSTTSQQIAQTSELGQATVSSSQPSNLKTAATAQPTVNPQPTPQPGPQCDGTTLDNPATSCKEIHNCNPTAPSGYYWVNTTTRPLQVYCQMKTKDCGNITGGWMRAAYIDMTNVNNTCPQGLMTRTVANSTHMCTPFYIEAMSGISSVAFPTHGVPYTKVCGRARGYQFYATSAFFSYYYRGQTTLDSCYVSGLSVTYGSPRNHIWSFAVGQSKDYDYTDTNCPCASPYPGPAAPPFVGDNYFCESGNIGELEDWQWYLDDPLWDSQGCASGSTCCDRGSPWFTTTLSQEVSDDIEVRLCNFDSFTSDIGVEQLEIFIY